MKHCKILIVTTVPETLSTILANQPEYLSRFFSVYLASSKGVQSQSVISREGVPLYTVNMKREIGRASCRERVF